MNNHDATEQAFKNGYAQGIKDSNNSIIKCEFCKHNFYNGGGCNRNLVISHKTNNGIGKSIEEIVGLDYCSNGELYKKSFKYGKR